MHFGVIDLQLMSLTQKCKMVQNRTPMTDMADVVLPINPIPFTVQWIGFLPLGFIC